MVAPLLVAARLEAGGRLVEALDQTIAQPFAAFWIWDPDAEEWRLVIGSEAVRTGGPSSVLKEVQQVLLSGRVPPGALELRDVLVVGPGDRRLDALRSVPSTGRLLWTDPAPYAGSEGPYIYRNGPPSPEASDVVTQASQQASALLNRGMTPRVVELGQQQSTALRRAGVTGDTLVMVAPVGVGPQFVAPGESYPSTSGRRLELRIKRVPRADWVHVAA